MDNEINFPTKLFNYFSPPIELPEDYVYVVNRAGCSMVDQGFEICRDNGYGYCVIHYVYHGTGLLIVGKEEYRLKAGDIFILGSKEPHIYSGNDEDRLGLLWVEFYGCNSSYLMNIIRNKKMIVLHSPNSDIPLDKLLAVSNYLSGDNVVDLYEVSVLLYDLICSLLKQCTLYEKSSTVYPPHIKTSIQFIKANIKEIISVAQLAKLSNCSFSYFTKTFTHTIGVTPLQYIMMNKIEESNRLMATQNITCEEIAEQLGFYDSSHFTKVYKKYTGQTPKQFKLKNSN